MKIRVESKALEGVPVEISSAKSWLVQLFEDIVTVADVLLVVYRDVLDETVVKDFWLAILTNVLTVLWTDDPVVMLTFVPVKSDIWDKSEGK